MDFSGKRFWAGAALQIFVGGSAIAAEPPPIDTGLVERTGVSLLLLDVRVTGADGQPIPGLGREDFRVFLDGRVSPVQTIDDLCTCAEPLPEAALASPAETAVPASPVVSDPPRFVLYLDFSQFDLDGRVHAVREAKRWIRETMRPDDRVMIAAFATDPDLEMLADFTGDKERLVSVIDEASRAPEMWDPFPAAYPFRLETCRVCCNQPGCNCRFCWEQAARDEYFHGRRSLRAFTRLLEQLQSVPGRKALLLFNQRGTLFPAGYYPVDKERILDHIELVDQVAAEATLARTVIYPAFVGELENREATNYGANLAELTGGRHNLRLEDLSALSDAAGRGCECVYRLGLDPPKRTDHVYRAKVEVSGRKLPESYRVTYLSEAERWMRSARAVLADPGSARDIPVAAAIVPVAGRKARWEIKVRIAFDPEMLALLPQGATRTGNWEVGALLADAEAQRTWEMLGVSEVQRRGVGPDGVAILHERTFQGIPPGRYELRAFVRDRWANLYGGDCAEIVLPGAAAAGLAGPLVTRTQSAYLRTSLPLRRGDRAQSARDADVGSGALPLSGRPVVPGEPLEFTTWFCSGKVTEPIGELERYVSEEGAPLFRFEEPTYTRAGDCTALHDELDTSPMSAGRYTYHVRFRRSPTDAPEQAEVSFEIEAPRE